MADRDEESLDPASSLLNSNNSNTKVRSTTGTGNGLVEIPCCGCLSVQFYQPYFDINSDDVKRRLMHSLFFCKREELFLTLIEEKPDAYGPVWIATTLIFVIAVTSHMNSWVSSWIGGTASVYNFQNVVSAASLIYSFAGIAPVVIWFLFRQLDAPLKLISAICLYGYSLALFIPASLLCLIPEQFIAWVSLLGAGALSALFLLRNLGPIIVSSARQQAALLLMVIAIIQLSLLLSIKLTFFK